MKRISMVIKVRPEKLDEYKRLHAACWPGVLKAIEAAHLHNYSIFYRDGMLFTYLEYTGGDYDADMKKMNSDPEVKRWLKETDPCQEKLPTARADEWWSMAEEVFHTE